MGRFVFCLLFVFISCVYCDQQNVYSCNNCHFYENCSLPNCSCCGTTISGEKPNRPQLVFFSFDDAVTVRNYPLYVELFNETRLNPNGCPISMTLFVSHSNTDYSLVKSLYDNGMDIAIHGINHIKAESIEKFKTEALGQRENIAMHANIPPNEVVGYRSPYLIPYGTKHFEVLQKAGLQYDSTLTITKRSLTEESPFPFTLDYGWPYPCSIPTCPNSSIPGFWELPVVSVIDRLGLYPCVYIDGCINEPLTEEDSYNFLLQNFNSYYKKNKAPFGLNMHATWLLREYETNPYRMRAMHRFLDHILSLDDVFVVNMKQTMEWMKQQPSLTQLSSFIPFQCETSNSVLTMASEDAPTDDLETRQTDFSVPTLHSDSDLEQFEGGSQQESRRPNSLSGSQEKDSVESKNPHKTTLNKNENENRRDENIKNKIRQKRNSVKKDEPFNSGSEIEKNSNENTIKSVKGDTFENTRNKRVVTSTNNTNNAFSLMAKLTIANIPEQNAKMPSDSNNAIRAHSSKFSQNHIVVDPQHVSSDSNGRVLFIHNKHTARNVLNNIQNIQNRQSGSDNKDSNRKFNNVIPNLSQKLSKQSQSKDSMKPQTFSVSKRLQPNLFSPKLNRISFSKPKAYSAERLGKAFGVSHSFTNEIPTINLTSTRECKPGVNCHLPNCQCHDFSTSLPLKQTPQFVYFTYEGSINESIAEKLTNLFTIQRTNWDGCPIKGTVFVTAEGSNYTWIKQLYDRGFEIGLHGLKVKTLSSKVKSIEVAVQKYLLKRYAGIPEEAIKGWRSVGLQSKGDDQFNSLKRTNLLYDASLFVMTNLDNRTGMWPFTLDFGWQNNCLLQDCPTQVYAGLWEVPAVPYVGIKKRYLCKYVDSCYNQPRMSVQTYDFLLDNFMGIYKGDRKPFAVRIRSDWFQPGNEENLKGLDAFIELLQELTDVYIVSISDLISWMKNPVPHFEGEHTKETPKISC